MIEERFAPALLAWFDVHGRHDLPWQRSPTPYRVWVSEIMLQQTQVATVIPYYERFLANFANVSALAAAPIDEVLHLWSGLGYYARARNLKRAAELVVAEHGGVLPDTRDALMALPGIGRSTAGAILSIAHGQRTPILDGNVKRVLARWFAIPGWPGDAAVLATLWAATERVTPSTRVADYTQAIMDLGATLCVRGKPECGRCPVAEGCEARRAGTQREYPQPRPKKALRRRRTVTWLVASGPAGYHLVRRPPRGIWGGLWGFPEFNDEAAALAHARTEFDLDGSASTAPAIEHSFTHFDLTITPVLVRVLALRPGVRDGSSVWYNPSKPATVGLAAPVTELIRVQSAPQISLLPSPP